GEEAAVAGRVAGDQRPQGAQEVGDGVPADGQQGGREQQSEAQGGGTGEGAAEDVDQGAGGAGGVVTELEELASDGAVLAGRPPAGLAPLGLGQPRAPPLGYTGHRSLLARVTGSVLSP